MAVKKTRSKKVLLNKRYSGVFLWNVLAIFSLVFFFDWDDGCRVGKGKNGVISKSTGLQKCKSRKGTIADLTVIHSRTLPTTEGLTCRRTAGT